MLINSPFNKKIIMLCKITMYILTIHSEENVVNTNIFKVKQEDVIE